MARIDTLSNYLTDIATAIKTKKGDETPINASKFDEEIANLPSGGSGGADFEITSAAYLFSNNNRLNTITELTNLLSNECKAFNYMFNNCNSSSFTTPPFFYTGNGTSFNYMFYGCSNITSLPLYDISNGTNFSSMFQSCSKLVQIPQFNTSNGTDFSSMFNNCGSIETIPKLNTSKGTKFSSMFIYCKKLIEAPEIGTSKGTYFSSMFSNCSALTKVPELNLEKAVELQTMFNNCTAIENLGGFKDLGKAYLTSRAANYSNYTLDLSKGTNLTYDSLMNVINKLYDIASKGVKTQKLVLGSENLAKLTAEEINIAVEKGWSVS